MQIQQLRYVIKAAETGNFSAAAKSLFLSQPSLSQQILNLEQELGIPLFIRHSKSVTLTDAGEQFVKSAHRIVNEVDQLTENMKKYSLLQSGTLRIGMLWIAGYLKLPKAITDYHKLYPGITYHLSIEGSNTLLNMLSSRDINAAFVISSEKDLQQKDFYYKKIMNDYYMAIVSVQNPLSQKDVLSIQDLDNEPIIMPAKASSFRKDLEQVFSKHGIVPNVLCETSQSDIVMQLAGQNFAIGFSSNSIAQTLKNDSSRVIPLEVSLSRPVYYVTLKELLNYPVIQSFTSFIEALTF